MEIIPISQTQINGAATQTVNARELHNALGVKKPFTQWVEPKLKDSMLDEGQDYIQVFNQEVINPKGGRPSKEYTLTLDTAKHIAMMSRTAKAKEIRNYFIEAEKRYQSNSSPQTSELLQVLTPLFQTLNQSLIMIADTQKHILKTIEDQKKPQSRKRVIVQGGLEFDDIPTNQEREDLMVSALQTVIRNANGAINQSLLMATLGVHRTHKGVRKILNKYEGHYWESKYSGAQRLYFEVNRRGLS